MSILTHSFDLTLNPSPKGEGLVRRLMKEIVVLLYFLFLDEKKVTKKNQGQPEPSGRLSTHASPCVAVFWFVVERLRVEMVMIDAYGWIEKSYLTNIKGSRQHKHKLLGKILN